MNDACMMNVPFSTVKIVFYYCISCVWSAVTDKVRYVNVLKIGYVKLMCRPTVIMNSLLLTAIAGN